MFLWGHFLSESEEIQKTSAVLLFKDDIHVWQKAPERSRTPEYCLNWCLKSALKDSHPTRVTWKELLRTRSSSEPGTPQDQELLRTRSSSGPGAPQDQALLRTRRSSGPGAPRSLWLADSGVAVARPPHTHTHSSSGCPGVPQQTLSNLFSSALIGSKLPSWCANERGIEGRPPITPQAHLQDTSGCRAAVCDLYMADEEGAGECQVVSTDLDQRRESLS